MNKTEKIRILFIYLISQIIIILFLNILPFMGKIIEFYKYLIFLISIGFLIFLIVKIIAYFTKNNEEDKTRNKIWILIMFIALLANILFYFLIIHFKNKTINVYQPETSKNNQNEYEQINSKYYDCACDSAYYIPPNKIIVNNQTYCDSRLCPAEDNCYCALKPKAGYYWSNYCGNNQEILNYTREKCGSKKTGDKCCYSPLGSLALKIKKNSKIEFSKKAECDGFNAQYEINKIIKTGMGSVCDEDCNCKKTTTINPKTFEIILKLINDNLLDKIIIYNISAGKQKPNSKHFLGKAIDIIAYPKKWDKIVNTINEDKDFFAMCETKNKMVNCKNAHHIHIHYTK